MRFKWMLSFQRAPITVGQAKLFQLYPPKSMSLRLHSRGFLCLNQATDAKLHVQFFYGNFEATYQWSLICMARIQSLRVSQVYFLTIHWWKVVQMNRFLSLSLVALLGNGVIGCSNMSDDTSPRATNGPADMNISPTGTNADQSARTAGSGTMRGTNSDGTSNVNNSTDGRVGTGGTGIGGTSQGGAGSGTGGTSTGTGGTGLGGTSTGTGSGAGSAGGGAGGGK